MKLVEPCEVPSRIMENRPSEKFEGFFFMLAFPTSVSFYVKQKPSGLKFEQARSNRTLIYESNLQGGMMMNV